MNFGANKTPVEVIKEGTFGGTYFRDAWCQQKLAQKIMERI